MSRKYSDLDAIDRTIAGLLMKDATLTSTRLGEAVGLSPSAANERVRHLKACGAIRKIAAFVDADFLDRSLGAFLFLLVEGEKNNEAFLKALSEWEEVLECHHVTGEYSYLLKIRVPDTQGLEHFIIRKLKSRQGVTKTVSQIILSSPKEESVILS